MSAQHPHGSGVVITLQAIYNQLVTLTGEVAALSAKLDRAVSDLEHARHHVNDHENRLRTVEKRVWALPSAATVLALVALLLPFLGVN